MGEKCHFCEYDCGPKRKKLDVCQSCEHYNNFKVKTRMSEIQAYHYKRFLEEEKWANEHDPNLDRNTALAVLKELSRAMRPSNDIFGNKTLVIGRRQFELIRRKFLD